MASITDLERAAIVEAPGRFEVTEGAAAIRVRWRWRGSRWHWVGLVGFGLLTALMIACIVPLFHKEGLLVTVVSAPVSVGIPALFTYIFAGDLWNYTTITASRRRLKIAHGPLPWPRGRALKCSELRALEYSEVYEEGRAMGVWELTVRRKGKRQITLVSGLELDEASYLADALDRYCRIRRR